MSSVGMSYSDYVLRNLRDLVVGVYGEEMEQPPGQAQAEQLQHNQAQAQNHVVEQVGVTVTNTVNTVANNMLKGLMVEENAKMAIAFIMGPTTAMSASMTVAMATAAQLSFTKQIIVPVFVGSLSSGITVAIPIVGFTMWELGAIPSLPSREDLENRIGRVSKQGLVMIKCIAVPAIASGMVIGGTYVSKLIGEMFLNYVEAPQIAAGIEVGDATIATIAKVIGTLGVIASSALYKNGYFEQN